ncbi:hypothetical protein QR680_004924 [Steinernema hermaphroditum]|uniref:Uncharacterized protein n=1 Tax=Steinernema hermaphroditum TaxID=289476 RepID=A0AA39HSG7_9BILA|nr:hypothetical protein QR680_004924 [Steinernema hermaphroditum]
MEGARASFMTCHVNLTAAKTSFALQKCVGERRAEGKASSHSCENLLKEPSDVYICKNCSSDEMVGYGSLYSTNPFSSTSALTVLSSSTETTTSVAWRSQGPRTHGVPGRPGAPRGDDEDDRGEAEVLQRADCPSSKDDLSEPLASGGLPRCVPLSEGDDEVEVLQQRGPAALDEEGLGKPRNHHRPSESAQVRLLVVN